eukprot:2138827-Pleurochrysis_carterae.AAC.1
MGVAQAAAPALCAFSNAVRKARDGPVPVPCATSGARRVAPVRRACFLRHLALLGLAREGSNLRRTGLRSCGSRTVNIGKGYDRPPLMR